MPADDSARRPIPKSVPHGTIAHMWCVYEGDRYVMHGLFQRNDPYDYDRERTDVMIDESLKKYPDALRVFPEKIPVTAIEEEQARMSRIEDMLKGFVEEWTGGNVKLAAAQVRKWSYDVSEDDVRRAAKAVYGDDYV
ncbi:MAG: hypothetical protein OXP12_07240 [Thaumarchaeota archaeon]|nr:hypothetical protein [Nitrososphaerota archaeon]MDE0526468.1 hypothetical protein [Nitrososphaerota archaeon]